MPLQHLPRWILITTFLLAMNAGIVNVLGLFCLLHQSISHMTGNVSFLAMALLQQDFHHAFYLVWVLIFYVLGSSYSGFILGNSQFQLNQRYGLPMSLVAIFIALCWIFLPYYPRYALLWASAAMGMQNAMISHYKGTIIRTTHLSGVLTDLGLALGYTFKGLAVERRRVILHLMIFFGFLTGGVIAAITYPIYDLHAFLLPTALSIVLACVYWLIWLRFRKLT
ncbi:YoaK family protein [Acinetobacter rudis]|uniref:YoaK family protein n=1 Tax=Acinetobacter rudis TaxID=632955 RepID=UPI00280DCA24|nr:YoaK family protein [Acinetobacter rudis]MDQ8952130.1 YoaK family protein [Acinetobacter rudis]